MNEPFALSVCNRIRNLNAKLKEAKAQRAALFQERDGVLAELEECDEGGEAMSLKARHSDVVLDIDRQRKLIGWLGDQISETVDKADQPGLWTDENPEPPATLFAHKSPAKDEAEETDERPVGEPDVPGQTRFDDVDPDLPGAKNTARMRAEEAAEKTAPEKVDPETGEITKPDPLMQFPGYFRVTGDNGVSDEFQAESSEEFFDGLMQALGSDLAAIYQGISPEGRVIAAGKRSGVATVKRLGDGAPKHSKAPKKKGAKKSRAKAAK